MVIYFLTYLEFRVRKLDFDARVSTLL
jgi:hypothetical protein